MPGAGKSEIADSALDLDIPVIVMGDIIRELTRTKGLEPTHENTRTTMLQLREESGPGAVAKICLNSLLNLNYDVVVIEGCRSLDEVEVFRSHTDDLVIVGVHASPTTRFKRLQDRDRSDAPVDWPSFRERDLREISVGLGGVIAMSDIMILNETSLEEFRSKCKSTMRELI